MFVGASLVGSLLASLSISIGPGDHIHAISDRSTVAPLLLPTQPSAPQNLQAVAGDGQVTLTWDPPSDDGGAPILLYTIYRGNSSGGESFLITVPLVTTYIDLAVSNNMTYYYQVSATNAVGEGAMSTEASATPTAPVTAPGAPRNLQATPGDGQVTLNWQAPSNDGGSPILLYTIYRGNSSGGESFLITVPLVTTYTDATVTNGVPYYYQVSARNAIGEGPRSSEVSVTPATQPGAPQGLSAAPGDATVSLTWSPPSSNGGSPITNYRVYRGFSSGGETLLTTLGVATSYSDTTVTNGVTYYYEVSALNNVGEGPRSSEALATPIAPTTVPGAPRDLGAVAGDATVALAWSSPSSDGGSAITNYKVYRGTISGQLSLLATLPNVLSYTDSAVTNGQTYYYKVTAVNAVGEGPRSNEASGTPTSGQTVPSPPRQLNATPGDAQITLTWLAPSSDGGSPITHFRIYQGTASGGESLLTTIAAVFSYSDTSVTNGVTYYYYVTAVNVNGESGSSNEVSATPVAGPSVPEAPRNLVATPGNGTMTLIWSPPSSDGGSPITGYTLYRGTNSGNRSFPVPLGNVTTYTDTGLTNGARYYYRVAAVNRVGEGTKSNEASASPTAGPSVPSVPRNLAATAGSGVVTLRWSAPAADGGSPIKNYTIYRGVSRDSLVVLARANATSLFDGGLTNGVTYYYEVAAVNSIGEGPRSPLVPATPKASSVGTDTTKPSIQILSPVAGSSLPAGPTVVTGNASDNVGLALVEVSTDGLSWTKAAGTASWTATVNLTERDHTIYARATDGAGNIETATVAVTVSADGGIMPAGSDLPRSLVVTAVLSFAAAAGIAWFLLDRRRKESRRPMGSRRFRLGRNP